MFTNLTSLAALFALFKIATAQSLFECSVTGNVTLFWGTALDTVTTGFPLGFSRANVDVNNNEVLVTRRSVQTVDWVAIGCLAVGGGAQGAGVLSAIVDVANNLCLTVSNVTTPFLITRQQCLSDITSLTVLPDQTQSFAVITQTDDPASMVSFLGVSDLLLASGAPTNFVPSLVGGASDGTGATVHLSFVQDGFAPDETTETVLVVFE